MAHKKAGGSTALGRDSQSKRLGVKLADGDWAQIGAIIVRQRGSRVRAGKNAKMGSDDTVFATAAGIVKFTTRKIKKYTGKMAFTKFVQIVSPK